MTVVLASADDYGTDRLIGCGWSSSPSPSSLMRTVRVPPARLPPARTRDYTVPTASRLTVTIRAIITTNPSQCAAERRVRVTLHMRHIPLLSMSASLCVWGGVRVPVRHESTC